MRSNLSLNALSSSGVGEEYIKKVYARCAYFSMRLLKMVKKLEVVNVSGKNLK